MSLRGKTLFITGASRGIGLAIGLRAARDGANVAIIAKTGEPNPKLPGTVFTAAKEIDEAGGKGLPIVTDTMAKFGMSMCVLGMAGEFKRDGIAFNALWPRTTIATSAIKNLLGGDAAMKSSRSPAIMGDAAHAILCKPSREHTGNFY